MKNLIYIISTLLVVFSFTSCEDFLDDDPESVLGQTDFYTTSTRINQGVIACYAGMKSIINDEWMYTELRSDNTWVAATTSSSDTRRTLTNLAYFAVDATEVDLKTYWYNILQNLSNINAVLPSVLDNAYVTIEDDRAQYEAELRFMRAYHYFTLVNLFGDMFKVTDVVGPLEAKGIPRSPVSEIYDEIIIPDLLIAEEGAPSVYGSSEIGRITKWAAKSFLAKVYMQRGGADNLALAKPLLEEVINDSPHGLANNYADLYDPSLEYTSELNDEVIFAVRYKGGDSGNGSPFAEYFAPEYHRDLPAVGSGDGNNNPTWELASIFYDDDGEGDPLDPRAEASCALYYRGATNIFPYPNKYFDENMIEVRSAENDWVVIRYADVVLLYAELLAQDGNHATAHEYVNMVRERAGIPLANAFTTATMALDSVYLERRLELAFENQRWYDLLRMNTSYNDENKVMDILIKHTFVTDWADHYSTYESLSGPNEANYINDRLLLPIPQYEIDVNKDMVITQNPSYN